MHNLPLNYDPSLWPTWNDGLLTSELNQIINSFLKRLLNIDDLPQHSQLIAHLHTNKGSLGILFPCHRASPDFVITTTSSLRRAYNGFRPNIDLEPKRLHPSITNLYSTNTHNSHTLQRYNLLLPSIANIATPINHDPNDQINHFLTKLSPHSMRSRIKEYCGTSKAFSQHLRRSIKLATNNTTNPTQDHEEDDNLSTISNISTT